MFRKMIRRMVWVERDWRAWVEKQEEKEALGISKYGIGWLRR
jgi:hypothetical protein